MIINKSPLRFATLCLAFFAYSIPVFAEKADTGRHQSIKIGQSTIDLSISGKTGVDDVVKTWVQKSAEAVAGYYLRFPVKKVAITIEVDDGERIESGKTFGDGGARIFMKMGQKSSRGAILDEDWMMTHEMVHLALPDQERSHHWLEEGIATYVEPIARARQKHLTAERIWTDMVKGMPQGLPEAGDRGLDVTHTWGRTYWGGALFCLIADVEIRKQTSGRFGLEDALRGILAKGGDITVEWSITKTLATADEATGKKILQQQYEAWRKTPVKPDLTQLWRELGISVKDEKVTFDDKAPLASVRRSIVSGVP